MTTQTNQLNKNELLQVSAGNLQSSFAGNTLLSKLIELTPPQKPKFRYDPHSTTSEYESLAMLKSSL